MEDSKYFFSNVSRQIVRESKDLNLKEYAINILEKLGYQVSLTEKTKKFNPNCCPFCNNHDVKVLRDGILNLEHVECQRCGMSGPHVVGSNNSAIKQWNNIKFSKENKE